MTLISRSYKELLKLSNNKNASQKTQIVYFQKEIYKNTVNV